MKRHRSRILAFILLAAVAAVMIVPPFQSTEAGSGKTFDPYRAAVPAIDVNATSTGLRKATSAQLTVGANGSQAGDGAGVGLPPADQRFTTSTDVVSGIVVAGLAGQNIIDGVDYVDIPFVAKANSFGVDGAMDTFPVSVGALPDLDLQLLDDQDHILSTSGNFGPKEFVSGAITPGKTYRYRVVGFVNGPTQVNISSKQYFPAGMGPGTSGGSGGSGSSLLPTVQGSTALRVLQFTVNPLTKTVSVKL